MTSPTPKILGIAMLAWASITHADYVKVSNSGKALPDTATLGSGPNDWACTYDSKTKLMWEIKTDDGGLRDKDWRYTWYDSTLSSDDQNIKGVINPVSSSTNTCDLQATNCNTEDYALKVNISGLCGAKDWVLPTYSNLSTLTYCSSGLYSLFHLNNENFQVCQTGQTNLDPLVNSVYFPNIKGNYYWSSNSLPLDNIANKNNYAAYAVNFQANPFAATNIYTSYKKDGWYVLLVKNYEPVKVNFITQIGTAPLIINLDASKSTSTDDTKIISYAWSSSDGQTATGKTASLTFSQAGPYTITLKITDDKGFVSTKESTITVSKPAPTNQPPIAAFSAVPNTSNPLFIALDASASADTDGKIVGYDWASSDGQATSGKNSSLTFSKVGTYTVTLTVTDDKGATGVTQNTITVTAFNKALVPAFIASTTTGRSPLTVNVDASNTTNGSGSIAKYSWLSSTGKSATGKTASFVFDQLGSFRITLTVTDDKGATASTSQIITVKNTTFLGYNDTARNQPQIIMAGVTPSIIDIADKSIEVLALVRPGNAQLQNVTLSQGGKSIFNYGLKQINALANGDQFWSATLAFDANSYGSTSLPIKWGSGPNNFLIRATDTNQQSVEAISFPVINFSNSPAQLGFVDQTLNDILTYKAVKRASPQVIMAGVSPAIVDINDTSFDVVAMIRQGGSPINQVVLRQGGNPLFGFPMDKKTSLSNGDQIWAITFNFPKGAYGLQTMPIVWGKDTGEFSIEVQDSQNKPAESYPVLKIGNYPAAN